MSFSTSKYIGKQAYLTTSENDEEITVTKVGRIHFFAFHKNMCVGVFIKRPDVAMMIRRKDLFAPLNCIEFSEKSIIIDADYENKASKFLREKKIKLAQTFVYDAMNVACENAKQLGTVESVFVDDEGGIIKLEVSDGAVSDKLLGTRFIPGEYVIGVRENTGSARLVNLDTGEDGGSGVLVVKDEAGKVQFSGGATQKLATQSIKAKNKVVKTASKLKSSATPEIEKRKEEAISFGKTKAKQGKEKALEIGKKGVDKSKEAALDLGKKGAEKGKEVAHDLGTKSAEKSKQIAHDIGKRSAIATKRNIEATKVGIEGFKEEFKKAYKES